VKGRGSGKSEETMWERKVDLKGIIGGEMESGGGWGVKRRVEKMNGREGLSEEEEKKRHKTFNDGR
jgi:hypothetical protein